MAGLSLEKRLRNDGKDGVWKKLSNKLLDGTEKKE
jgi:hypothetical protein